ncbi:MAG: hypothetical protein ACI86C_000878 [Candidatus Latescibacterota bacterium]|jgi:hypothetical protein
MKLKLLFLSLFFATAGMMAQTQYTVEDGDGNLINDGDAIVFTVSGTPEASMDFYVTNTGASTINTKIEFVSALNADGSEFELCYGLCYTGISVGQFYPGGSDFVAIDAGMTTGPGNHFYNYALGSGEEVLQYVFRFFETDGAGNDIGNSLTFTYVYNPLLGVNENTLDIALSSTVIDGSLTVNLQEDIALAIYDLNGRIVQNFNLEVGQQTINMSNLSAQMYLLHFTNNKGISQVTKVLVK